VLEQSGTYLTPDGQLPHHFVNTTPTFVALSGETQTGPNLFWVLSCFNYVKNSGDIDWLIKYMPTLRKVGYGTHVKSSVMVCRGRRGGGGGQMVQDSKTASFVRSGGR
jgi:hypothetical protein